MKAARRVFTTRGQDRAVLPAIATQQGHRGRNATPRASAAVKMDMVGRDVTSVQMAPHYLPLVAPLSVSEQTVGQELGPNLQRMPVTAYLASVMAIRVTA